MATTKIGKNLNDIKLQSDRAVIDSWLNDAVGNGLKNTQQLTVNWGQWENHVFFHSAEAKTNIAIDKIINNYPFDGTSEEKIDFQTNIDGFTKWIFDQLDSSVPLGYKYANFTGTQTVFSKDTTGWLVPELSRTQVGQSIMAADADKNGITVQFWIYKDSAVLNQSQNQIVLQKLRNSNEGFSVYTTDGANDYSVSSIISSDDHKSLKASATLEYNEWHHVTFMYHRGKTERMDIYINGTRRSTTEAQFELDDITTADANLVIGGGGQTHLTEAGDLLSVHGLQAGLDELRLWTGTKTPEEISKNWRLNVDADPQLKVYYRFNEPATTSDWDTKPIVLDYSGNSLHAYIDTANSIQWENLRTGVIENTEFVEYEEDNKILFPDWPTTVALNAELIESASNYDKNNPNLITKLIPRHYFEESKFFEAIETELDEPLPLDSNHSSLNGQGLYSIPGHSKLQSKTIIMSFLLVWAAYFDDIKIYIDNFANLDKVGYTGYEQLPPILINFLAEYYNIPLTNPFADETLDRFQEGRNILSPNDRRSSLNKLVDTIWRRVLVNMPFLLRSRGTVNGIKSLMNTLGLESNSFFRLKEYGGNLNNTISSSRTTQSVKMLTTDFSKSRFAVVEDLKAYRHEPGLPDPYAAPSEGEVLFQSGDITITEPDSPPIDTQFLSGSWSWEAHYQLQAEETESLMSIIDENDNVLVNLISEPSTRTIQFHSLDYDNDQQVTLEIDATDTWDDNLTYIAVSNTWKEDSRLLEIQIGKSSSTNISLWRSEVSSSPRDNTKVPADLLMTNPGVQHNLYLGDPGITPSGGLSALTLACKSKVVSPKFWSRPLSEKEAQEHCKNPLSIYNSTPIISDPIPKYQDGLMIAQNPDRYRKGIPSGSWERLRFSFQGLEDPSSVDYSSNIFEFIDTTQNMFTLEVHGTSGVRQEKVLYSIVAPDFDSNSTENKVRVRSYSDEGLARANGAHFGPLYELGTQVGLDDRRFSIESSIVHALNKDMVNLLGNLEELNEYIGAPELEYAVDYPELRRIREIYFQRLVQNMPYNSVIEFQRWFNNHFAELVEKFIPYTADFLGINFIIESHILERHKFEYKQGDVHVDLKDRVAFSQVPIIIGTVRNEIT